jgi:hypothetical protein
MVSEYCAAFLMDARVTWFKDKRKPMECRIKCRQLINMSHETSVLVAVGLILRSKSFQCPGVPMPQKKYHVLGGKM